MMSQRHKATLSQYGVPSPSFSKGTIVLTLIAFIEKVIVSFQINNPCAKGDIEDLISQHLSNRFNDQARKESAFFLFDRQTIEKQASGRSRALDIGVFRSYVDSYPDINPFFVIEAKRLPTPESARYREYVSGSKLGYLSGGIERFKHKVHGQGLTASSIIGYVQDDEPRYWIDMINSWIDDLISTIYDPKIEWHTNDKLINQTHLNGGKVIKLISNNKRIDNTFIELTHYLVAIG